MTEFKSVIVVQTNESGQPTNLLSLEDGDTISNEVLNNDVRNAASGFSTLETSVVSLNTSTEDISGYITTNQAGWNAGIDAGTLANIQAVSATAGATSSTVNSTSANNAATLATAAATSATLGSTSATVNSTSATNAATAATAGATSATVLATSAVNQATTATAKSTSATLGATSSTAAATSATVLGASANNLATLATAAATSATAAATSATVLGASANNLATLATAAATSATLGSTSATAAATSATVGGASGNNLATLATAAATSATLAATSATAGATSATVNSTSGNNAATLRTAAATSATLAEVSAGTNTSGTAFLTGNTPTLSNDLDADGNDVNNISFLRGQNAGGGGANNFVLSGQTVYLTGKSKVLVGETTAAASSLIPIINDLAGVSGTGGGGGGFLGSAIASAIAIGNGSSVSISGTDDTAIDVPADGNVLILDTEAARFKYGKIGGAQIINNAIDTVQLADGAVSNAKLGTGAALANTATNSVTFSKLQLINAQTIVGNPEASLGGPMQAMTKAQTRNILGVSAGTNAPPSPDAGDLWYNTTDDELYTYDSGRGHWLGAPHYISFGKANAATNAGVGHFLYVGHQGTAATTNERGWLVPHDMVITGWRGHTQSTFDGWNARVDKNSGGTNTTGVVATGALGAVDTFSDFTLDVDVAAGDILGVALVLGSVTLNNSTVTVKIQRKGA